MISFMICPAGAFSDWCKAIIERMPADRDGTYPTLMAVDSLADLGRQLLKGVETHIVAVAYSPEPSLCDLLVAEGTPLIMLVEEPGISAAFLVEEQGVDPAVTIRAVANAHAATMALGHAANALILSVSDLADETALALRLAAHLGFPADPEFVDALVARPELREIAADAVQRGRRGAHTGQQPDWQSVLMRTMAGEAVTTSVAAMVQGAIDPIDAMAHRDEAGAVVWARDLFYDARGLPAIRTIDLTGASHCLMYGPYLRLPPGYWSCALMFACDEAAVGMPLVADITAGSILNQISFVIDSAGIFEIELAFENTNPDNLIEVRLFSGKATFEGTIAVGRAKISRLEAKRLKAS